jgi:translation initiation factor 2B subunit (eIF-2B alpha/beta/delta family)
MMLFTDSAISSNGGDVQVDDMESERLANGQDLDEEFKKQAENLDKARNLLSSRMNDVRALKRMVSETKETIENKRRLKIMQEIQ